MTTTPDYNDMATKVIRGVYGNGNERRQALGGAYDRVMAIVNQRLGGGSTVSAPANTNCGSVCVTVKSGDTLSTMRHVMAAAGTSTQVIVRATRTSSTLRDGLPSWYRRRTSAGQQHVQHSPLHRPLR